MALQSDILIIGNGAVGKTAALGFAQAGFAATLLAPPIAQAVHPVPVPQAGWDARVYALNHAAHDLLSSLRVWDAMDATRIAAVDAMQVYGDGARAGKLDFDAYGARSDALAWIVEDANLTAALDAAMRFAANLRVVHGRATGLQTGDGHATVTLDDGEALHAPLLVGADGAHSWVRGQCDIGIDYRSYHQHAVVTNFECERPHHGVAHQWFTSAQGIVALLPLPGRRVSLVWSAPDALAQQIMGEPLSQLAQRLAEFAGPVLGELRPIEPESVKSLPLALIRPHAITAPHVALVGDAAHAVHPLAGHGMNLGFADVAALVAAVSAREPQQAIADERVLARYARSRKEDILLMQLATDGLERLFSAQFEPLRIARNIGMNLVNQLPFLKNRLVAHALDKR